MGKAGWESPDSVQQNLKALQTELSKGKSSAKAQAALDELHYLTSFNQNVTFAMGKSLQHLSDFTFVQMANLTLLRRKINFVKGFSIVDHCVFAQNVPSAPSVAHAQLVGGRLHLGANPRVVSISKDGYILQFKIRPPLVRDQLIISGYANTLRNLYLKEALHVLIHKKAIDRVRVRTSLAFFNILFIVPKPNKKW